MSSSHVTPYSIRAAVAAVVIAGLVGTAATAEEVPESSGDAPLEFVSEHALEVPGGELRYRAVASETWLRNEKDEPTASFFTIAYTRTDTPDAEGRPIAFIFNGGPGSSSVWLHLGLLGPRRVAVPEDGTAAVGPPYSLEANPHSLLRVSDLVFVDPIGTGYSRALGEKNNRDYWGVDEDADSVSEFIRRYLSEHRRWNSPKFLIGESYGTIRASLLVSRLQSGLNSVFLNGVILISPAMDVGTLPFITAGNDFPFIGHLPSFAATAAYHGKLAQPPESLEAFLEEVVEFASTDYLMALFKGDALEDAERDRIVAKLQTYAGLSEGYIRQTRLRIGALRFTKELLRDRGQTVGLLDGRFLGEDPDDAGEYSSHDPSGIGVSGAFVAGLNTYLLGELGVQVDREYIVLNTHANQGWQRGRDEQGFFNGFLYATSHLASGAAANRDLRFMVVSGYHDLTTAFFAARQMIRHSGLPTERVRIEEYPGGHMMYLHQASFERLTDDIVEFVTTTSP
jgi:carboxypeptidase C (cathepsin A)